MAFTLDDEGSDDLGALLVLLPLVDRHGNAVRKLVAEQAEGLLADRLGREEARRAVRVGVGIEERDALGEELLDLAEQVAELAALFSGHGHDGRKRELLHRGGHERKERVLRLVEVRLVDGEDDVRRILGQKLEDFEVGGLPAEGLDHEDDRIDLAERGAHGAVHAADELVADLRLEPRGVHEDDLGVGFGHDAEHAVARRLRLLRGDRDLLADQVVDQGRLADVRTADDGHIAAAEALGHLHGGGAHLREHAFKFGVGHCRHGLFFTHVWTSRWWTRGSSESQARRWRPPAQPSVGSQHGPAS